MLKCIMTVVAGLKKSMTRSCCFIKIEFLRRELRQKMIRTEDKLSVKIQ